MHGKLQLLVVSGVAAGKRFPVGNAPLRLGRSSASDICIVDERLSRMHCLFEPDGSGGVGIIDLASANGTTVNGRIVGGDPMPLSVGDKIEVGGSVLEVVADGETKPRKKPVDLGLGGAARLPQPPAGNGGRTVAIRIVAAIAVAVAIAAVLLVPLSPQDGKEPSAQELQKKDADDRLYSFMYEKVEADATHIFRFLMTLDADGRLSVVCDDVPSENKFVDKSTMLSDRAKTRMAEIVDKFDSFDGTYSGSGVADNLLESRRVRYVRGGAVKDVCVVNTVPPDGFRTATEELETFARNELGVWALQYSRGKLVELSAASEAVGDAKWEERTVVYSNLALAIKAYREAVFYLETVDPKPEGFKALSAKLDRALKELDGKYEEQRFLADKALNMGDWETAREELGILCEIINDKNDPRYTEAHAKLVDVQKRISSGKRGGSR